MRSFPTIRFLPTHVEEMTRENESMQIQRDRM